MSFPTVFCALTLSLLSTLLLITNVSATSRPIFTVKAGSVDLHKICEGTVNPALCLQTMNSDARTKTAPDMNAVISISLDIATKRAGKTHAAMIDLSAKTTNMELKARYSECSSWYGRALDTFVKARADFEAGKKYGMGSKVSDVVSYEENCDDLFEVPPVEPTQVVAVVKEDALVSLIVHEFAIM